MTLNYIMKLIVSLSVILAALEVSNAGPFFKAGFIKGALKGKMSCYYCLSL